MSTGSEFANIGKKEAERLRTIGRIALACGIALGLATVYYQFDLWTRPTLFLLYWFGTALLLQAKRHTSILLAARRLRRIDGREEPELHVIALREQAGMIQRRSFLLAVVSVTFVVACL